VSLRRPCAQPRCPALVPLRTRHCPRHAKEAQLRIYRRQGSKAKQGYGKRWRKLRKVIIARDPICKICGVSASRDVDHIEPKRPEQDAADFREDQLQGICKPCHGRKTRAEQMQTTANCNTSILKAAPLRHSSR
jgi:5-methylcytosine-specific restriction enzyme A